MSISVIKPPTVKAVLEDNQFIVPYYQRQYKWNSRNVNDFLKCIKQDKQNRAKNGFGSLTVAAYKGSDFSYQLIDGQQRLTTLTIFASALRNVTAYLQTLSVIDKRTDELKQVDRLKDQLNSLLFITSDDQLEELEDDGNIKDINHLIHFHKTNNDVLHSIVKENADIEYKQVAGDQTAQNLINAYNKSMEFIKNELKEHSVKFTSNMKLEDFQIAFDVIRKYYDWTFIAEGIGTVGVDPKQEFTVFDRINSQGTKLSVADQARLRLIAPHDNVQDQVQVVKQWDQMANTLYNKDSMIKQYIANISNCDGIDISELTNSKADLKHADQALADVVGNVETYIDLLENKGAKFIAKNSKSDNNKLGDQKDRVAHTLENLIKLGQANSPYIPLILSLLNKFDYFNKKDFSTILDLLLKYSIEFSIVQSYGKDTMTKVFNTIANHVWYISSKNELQDYVHDEDGLIQTIKDNMIPTDLVTERLKTRKFSGSKDMLIAKLILAKTTWTKNEVIPNSNLQLEHVMPQNPKDFKTWTSENQTLTNKEQYNDYIQKLGNMLLLNNSDNVRIGNKDFDAKKSVYLGSEISTTKDFAEKYDKWTTSQIDERTNMLAGQIANVLDA